MEIQIIWTYREGNALADSFACFGKNMSPDGERVLVGVEQDDLAMIARVLPCMSVWKNQVPAFAYKSFRENLQGLPSCRAM